MVPAQARRIAKVFEELRSPNTKLHFKVIKDLRSGAVRIGNTTRRNPGIRPNEMEEAMSEIYLGLCKLPWPWRMHWSDGPQEFANEETANIVCCKLVTLQVLTLRRNKANRNVLEADLGHYRMVEGNALVHLKGSETMERTEMQDTFSQENTLNSRINFVIAKDPAHRSQHDYRLTTPIKAKCCPERGHFAKGWCQHCYGRLGKNFDVVPLFTKKLSAKWTKPVTARPAKTLTKVSAMKGLATSSNYETFIPARLLLFIEREYAAEWWKTLADTTPTPSNDYKHASIVRGLNRLHQKGLLCQYEIDITRYNDSLKKVKV